MRVLYVATDLRDADILQQEVRRVASGLTLEICAGLSELRARPDQSGMCDVLLMDCSLSEAEQLQVIHYARVRQLAVPVVGVMGTNAALPSAALSAGLDDLLVRGPKFADRLGPALRLSTERFRNVTQAVRENERLKRSEARLRLIIEALPAGVVLLDQAGKILAMNAAGVQTFGSVSPQDMVGRSFQTLLPVEDHPGFQEFLAKTGAGDEASLQFSGHDDGDAPGLFNLRGLCIQRDEGGQHAVLAVIDRLAAPTRLSHAWSPDFDLDAPDLSGPELLSGPALAAPIFDGASPLGESGLNEDDLGLGDMGSLMGTSGGAAVSGVDPVVLEEARARASELEARLQAADAWVATLQGRCETAETRGSMLDAECRAATARITELDSQREAANVRVTELEARVAELDAQRQAAEGRGADMETQHQAADARVLELDQEIARLREASHAAAEREATLTRAMSSASAEDEARQAETLASLAGDLEAARVEIAALTERVAREQDATSEAEAALAHKDARLLQLEQHAQARIGALEQEHRVAVERLQELLDQAMKDSQAAAMRNASAGGADGARRGGAERVGRLAAAMAADLNGAAEAAMDAARAVVEAWPGGSSGRDQAERTLETVSRCAELSRHLLRTSTRYMGQPTRIDLSQLVRQQDALLHHLAGPDIELQFELSSGLTSAELDAQEVTQVLTSLAVAARDALPLGGVIRVATTAQRADSSDSSRGDRLRPLVLAVTARGYGIRPVSSATCEDVASRCGGLLTTVIEPGASWTLIAMLPGSASDEVEAREDLTRSA